MTSDTGGPIEIDSGGVPLREQLIRNTHQRELENAWDGIFKVETNGGIENYPYEFFSRVRETFKDRGVKTVVDAACGASARHIKPLLSDGFEVSGFDLSKTALNLTTMNLQKNGYEVPRLEKHDLFESPWPFKQVDAVIMIQALYHGFYEEIERAIKIVNDEVLVPGGTFVFTATTDVWRSTRGADLAGLNLEDIFDEPEKGTFVPKVGREKGLPHRLMTNEEILSLLDGKFRQVQIHEDNANSYLIVDAVKNGDL